VSAAESSVPDVERAAAARILEGAALRRVLANVIALVVAYALPRILTLGAVILAARVLGAARFGAYGAAGAAGSAAFRAPHQDRAQRRDAVAALASVGFRLRARR
jgi:hypothetical protein